MRVCLQKEAKRRVRDIGAVRLAMEGAFETEAARTAIDGTRPWHRALPWLLVAALAVAAGLILWSTTRAPASAGVSRTSIVLPQTHVRTNTGRRGIAVSPDGTHLAYVANDQLYLRALDELEPKPLAGTEASSPTLPFFSPDGKWIGFYSTRDGQLEKVALTGGAAIKLCSTANPYGASWGSDDTIVFGEGGGGVVRVSASGGTPEVLIAVDANKGEHAHGPQILPDGRTVLFTLGHRSWDDAQIVVQSLDSGERRVLIDGGTDARYLPTGHLVYALSGNLLAVPFDVDRLEIQGGPVPLVERVSSAFVTGGVNFDVSRDGMLVYLQDRALVRTLVWVDRDGREEPVAAEPRIYNAARISPDGTQAILEVGGEERDLWVWDFARETLTRLTFAAGADVSPVWMPDGRRVVFSSNRDGAYNLYRKAVDGTGATERLSESSDNQFSVTVTPDGTRVVFVTINEETRRFHLAMLQNWKESRRWNRFSPRTSVSPTQSFLPMAIGSL